MPQDVPPILIIRRPVPPERWWVRVLWAGAAAACLVVLGLAASVMPSPQGMGTHLELGLKPCGFLRVHGVPCMTCGMTTSFSHLAHGQVVASFLTQPMGFVLAILTAAIIWVGGYIAVTGVPAWRITRRWPKTPMVLGLLGFGVAAWAYKIAMVMAAG